MTDDLILLHSIHQARGLGTPYGGVAGFTPKKPQYRCSRRHRLRGVRQKRGGERQVLYWALTLFRVLVTGDSRISQGRWAGSVGGRGQNVFLVE